MGALHREKLAQAAELVKRTGLDLWITFVRETGEGGDPVLPLLLEGGLTWQSALVVGRDGRKVAIVGNYDADPLKASGDWDEVIPYVQGIAEPLRTLVTSYGSPKIGVNVSLNDDKADGLTHGMYLILESILKGTGAELVSAESLLLSLRGVKTAEELRRIRKAIEAGDVLFDEIGAMAKVGVSEKAVYDFVHGKMKERKLGFAWHPAGDPIVNSGPNSMIGHGIPSPEITIQPGHVFHIDLGVILDEYSSDIQRCWYVGDSVPDDVQHGLDSVNRAISAGAAALKPGAVGHEVDMAARSSIQADGYPEYLHALGHQVGRVAHDGGALLGPRWERYGDSPIIPIEEGQIFTLELGVVLPGRGYLGIEEMVVVTADGCEFLSQRQLTMPCIS